MDRLDVRTDKAKTDERGPFPFAALISLLTGVWGLLLLLRAVPGVEFSLGRSLSATALLCAVLWYGYWRDRRIFYPIFLIAVGVCGYTIYTSWETLLGQVVSIGGAFADEAAPAPEPVTELALLSGAALTLLLFALEVLLKSHILFYLLTTAILLAAPFLGIRPTVEAVFLLIVFQIAFRSWQRAVRRRKRALLFPARQLRVAGKSAFAVCLFLVLVGVVAIPLVISQSERLYDSVYRAEGYVYRRLAGDQANDPITGGRISRGNNYQRGVPHLELTASRQPTETLYLRGFGGGEYIGGDWIRSSDEAVFQEAAAAHGWEEWIDEITGRYYRMYFERNSELNGDEMSISLTIRHSSGNYGNAYVPYYSRRQSRWLYNEARQSRDGYIYDYFEQKDMHIDPDYESEATFDWYPVIQTMYMEQIQEDYTLVPTELLPKLTALVEGNPLSELDEITAFILYTLHSNTEYTLTPGWTTLRQDVAEDFLFERRRGYCEHFALVGTLMYRLYGIPARYATGYRVEPRAFTPFPSFSAIASDEMYAAAVTDEDAHAWVEIFLPDYGWTPVEVTPSADGHEAVSYPGFGVAELDQIWKERGWDVTEPSLEEQETERTRAQAGGSDFSFNIKIDWNAHRDILRALLTGLIELILLVSVLLDFRRLRRLKRTEKADCRETFTRLLELLHFAGRLTDCDGSEPNFAERLSEAAPEISGDDAQRLVAAVNRAAFGASPSGEEENAFARALYRRAAQSVYSGLTQAKKLTFKWLKAFG